MSHLKKGDRVIIPFNIGCGDCFYCNHQLESQCDNANPHGDMGAYFGYSENTGGYAKHSYGFKHSLINNPILNNGIDKTMQGR